MSRTDKDKPVLIRHKEKQSVLHDRYYMSTTDHLPDGDLTGKEAAQKLVEMHKLKLDSSYEPQFLFEKEIGIGMCCGCYYCDPVNHKKAQLNSPKNKIDNHNAVLLANAALRADQSVFEVDFEDDHATGFDDYYYGYVARMADDLERNTFEGEVDNYKNSFPLTHGISIPSEVQEAVKTA